MDFDELFISLKTNGYPNLTVEELEEALFDLEKNGYVELEVTL